MSQSVTLRAAQPAARVHLVAGRRTLCGLSQANPVAPADLFAEEAGRRVWAEREADRCDKCAERLAEREAAWSEGWL